MNGKRRFWFWVGIGYAIAFLLSLFLLTKSATIMGTEWNWGLATLLGIILYTVASIQQLGPTELGARTFFGKPIGNVSSGFVFLPYAPSEILHLERDSSLIVQNEFPGEPEKIYRGDGPIPPGMVPPVRIAFGKPQKADEEIAIFDRDPFSLRLTEEVVPIVRWRIENYAEFLSTIGTIENATKQLEDLCFSTLSREFGQVTIAQVIADYAKYNQTLTDEIELIVTTWGITLESARVKVINFSHDLNKAVQKIAEETAKGKARVIEAESLKEATSLDGQGRGEAEKSVLKGRTDGLEDMSRRLGVSGHAVLAAETARGITSNPGQKTIIAGSGGFSDLATVGTVLGEALKGDEQKSIILVPKEAKK
jgi:regulator of protease activity HflC (stomatin/prohibitin superfamily)